MSSATAQNIVPHPHTILETARQLRLSLQEIGLLMFVLDSIVESGGVAELSRRELATAAGICKAQIGRHLDRLVEVKALEAGQLTGRGRLYSIGAAFSDGADRTEHALWDCRSSSRQRGIAGPARSCTGANPQRSRYRNARRVSRERQGFESFNSRSQTPSRSLHHHPAEAGGGGLEPSQAQPRATVGYDDQPTVDQLRISNALLRRGARAMNAVAEIAAGFPWPYVRERCNDFDADRMRQQIGPGVLIESIRSPANYDRWRATSERRAAADAAKAATEWVPPSPQPAADSPPAPPSEIDEASRPIAAELQRRIGAHKFTMWFGGAAWSCPAADRLDLAADNEFQIEGMRRFDSALLAAAGGRVVTVAAPNVAPVMLSPTRVTNAATLQEAQR